MTTTVHVTDVSRKCDHIRLIWNIDGWRWSRQFHGSLERPLSSSVYETVHCKWVMELHLTKKSEMPDHDETVRVALCLLDCDSNPSSVIVRGDLKIGPSPVSVYHTQPLSGRFSVGEVKCSPRVKYAGYTDSICVVAQLKVYIEENVSTQEEISEIEDHELQMKNLSNDLASFLDFISEHDLNIYVDDEVVHGHQAIFAVRCSKLRSEFLNSRKGTKRQDLEVTNCSLEAWNVFQRFVYTGQLSTDISDNYDVYITLLRLSEEYGIECLKDAVASHMEAALKRDTVFDLIDIFYEYKLERLKSLSLQIVKSNLNYFKSFNRSSLLDGLQKRAELMHILLDCL